MAFYNCKDKDFFEKHGNGGFRVTVDGTEVDKVVVADTFLGYVECYRYDLHGNAIFADNSSLATCRFYGTVVVTPKEPS